MNYLDTDKYALQKVQIRNTMSLEEAKKHYKSITKKNPRKIRETINFYQFRFLPPTKFEPKTFRTKVINDDIRLIYGKLKENNHHLEGGGLFDYFTKAYDYVKNKVSDAFSYIKNAVSINDYSDSTKKNLGLYGEYPIIAIQLRRAPISFALDLALQGISAGEWERLKEKNGFDKLYHLSMVVTLKGITEIILNKGRKIRQNKQLAIEKVEVVSVNENITVGEGMETQDVIIPKDKVFNINGMFQKARDKVGDTRFFSYSALGQNNCQDFIALLLDVEGLYNEPEKDFVYQDISQLVKELPDTTKAISQGITHIGALANKYFGIGGGNKVSLDDLYHHSANNGDDIVIPKKEFVKEHKHLIGLLNKSDDPELKKEANIQAKELELKGGAVPINRKLYEKVKSIVYPRYKKASAYRSGAVIKLYKEMGGKFKNNGGRKLSRWFEEEWKDIGNHQEYPVYRPTKRITKDTPLTVDEIDPKNLKEQIKEKQKIKGEHNLKPFKEVGSGECDSDDDSDLEGGIKAPISRVGGKRLLKKKIIAEFPDNYEDMTYVEPFIGGGSVFYAKNPSKKEVINDLDDTIFNIHKGLQKYGKKIGKSLIGHYTPADFYRYKKSNPKSLEKKLSLFLVLSRISFLGQHKTPKNKKGTNIKTDFAPYQERLKDTIITNQDYSTIIKKYDSLNTLFYLDPPYEGSTKHHYDNPDFDLDKLHDQLKKVKGKWILSMNDSPNVRKIFKNYPTKTLITTYQLPEKRQVKELLIKNFQNKTGGGYETDSDYETSDSVSEEEGITQDEAISQFYEYMKAHKGQDINECFQKWKHQFYIEIK